MALTPALLDIENLAGQARGSALRELQLFDQVPSADFDNLVALAAMICGKPMGAMTLLDESTLLIKAQVGLSGTTSVPLKQSMCQYTVRGSSLLMIEDMEKDPALEPMRKQLALAGLRFYAGMPLLNNAGIALGALCVMDTEPTTLNQQQQRALTILGQQVSHLIHLRQHARVMERMAAERERAQKMFDIILNHVPIGIYLKDSSGHLRFYNQSIADRFRINREEWMGKTSFDLWDSKTAHDLENEERAVLQSGAAHESFATIPEPDGHTSHWKSYKVPCQNADGEQMLACCSIDLTEQMQREAELQRTRDELQEANRKLSSLALTDALTGLWNRRAFDARLETSIISAHRGRQTLTLMLIDVDHFKHVNDRYGHPYGDSVLKDIATLLNRVKRAEDAACRFGGEEFAVLLPGTDVQAARHLADRMLKATRQFLWEKSPVTISIGLAMCSDNCLSDELVDKADSALYQAKRGGRDQVVLYTEPPLPTVR